MRNEDDWQLTSLLDYAPGRGDPFAAAIRGTCMPMIITDTKQPDHLMVFANAAFAKMTGYTVAELIGRDCRFLQGPDSDPAAVQAIRDGLNAEQPVDVELLNYRKDGSTFWNGIHITPVRDDGGAIRFWVASMMDITDSVETKRRIISEKAAVEEQVRIRTAELEVALTAKTTLLHELDHRVKNNLTMIGSLVRLQSRGLADPVSKGILDDMLARVDALAAVHRRLFQSEDVTKFDLGGFTRSLATEVLAGAGRSDVAIETDVDPVAIGAGNAAAVGLIINELITNSVKHAFAGRRGVLKLGVHSVDEKAVITLEDDGPGFDPSQQPVGSLGRPLIERLSRQIGATISWADDAPGTRVSIKFAIDE